MVRSALLALVALITSVALVACGEGSDEEQIQDTVATFLEASKEEDVAKFCGVVFVGGEEPCEDQITTDNFVGSGDVENIEVTEIEIDGEIATAQGTATVGGEERTDDLRFRNVDGDWKLDFSNE